MTAAIPHAPVPSSTPRLSGVTVTEDAVMRVKSGSNAKALASAIAHSLYAGQPVTLRAIGAGAVGQAVKALIAARGFAAPAGIDIAFIPAFATVTGDKGDTVSAITFRVVRLG